MTEVSLSREAQAENKFPFNAMVLVIINAHSNHTFFPSQFSISSLKTGKNPELDNHVNSNGGYTVDITNE